MSNAGCISIYVPSQKFTLRASRGTLFLSLFLSPPFPYSRRLADVRRRHFLSISRMFLRFPVYRPRVASKSVLEVLGMEILLQRVREALVCSLRSSAPSREKNPRGIKAASFPSSFPTPSPSSGTLLCAFLGIKSPLSVRLAKRNVSPGRKETSDSP